ncbi:MAG: hypothetical protein ACFFG0_27050 [Candidatus Thorarchaeota archaeon]
MTAIIKEKKKNIVQDDFNIIIINMMDISNFPMPAEIYISEKDIAW